MTINIKPENSAFLFIDIQEKLVGMLKKDKISKKASILAKAAKILNIKTVITEQYPAGLGLTVGVIKENLNSNAEIIEKTKFSALEEVSESIKNFENIFVFGIETQICVFQTVVDLLEKNYNVLVIRDACASRETDEFKASINLMEKEGAKIITTEMVLFEMIKSSKHPDFKEIQALIK